MSELAHTLTTVALFVYLGAGLLYAAMWLGSSRILRVLAPVTLAAGLAINIYQMTHRWLEADQPPFKTLFESLVLLAACIAVVYLVFEGIYRARVLGLPLMSDQLMYRDGFAVLRHAEVTAVLCESSFYTNPEEEQRLRDPEHNLREAYGMFACNGILFNHESPIRGETFVTRKITRAAARIRQGLEKVLAEAPDFSVTQFGD